MVAFYDQTKPPSTRVVILRAIAKHEENAVNLEAWHTVAVLINLITFFFSFASFSVGLYMANRVKTALGRGMLSRMVTAFLVASGALAVRTLVMVFTELAWIPRTGAEVIGDLALLVMGGGIFGGYIAIEGYFKKISRRQQTDRL